VCVCVCVRACVHVCSRKLQSSCKQKQQSKCFGDELAGLSLFHHVCFPWLTSNPLSKAPRAVFNESSPGGLTTS